MKPGLGHAIGEKFGCGLKDALIQEINDHAMLIVAKLPSEFLREKNRRAQIHRHMRLP